MRVIRFTRESAAVIKISCALFSHLSPLALPLAAGELPIVPAAQAGLLEEKLARVDQFIERQISNQRMAGSIVIVAHNNKVGFFHTYGWMDREAKKPMRPDALFRFRSMTKAITTAAALQLVDAGKMSLDDPVSKYIPSFAEVQVIGSTGLRPPSRKMTIRDLMRHTSGLSYGNSGPDGHKEEFRRINPNDSSDLKEFCDKLSQVPLAFDPGTHWVYSLSTDVLGRVIEILSGQSLDTYLKTIIFDPLGMTDTAFQVSAANRNRLAAVYRRSPDGLKSTDYPGPKFLSGGGGLIGTASDYMRFLLMIQNGGEFGGRRILRPDTVKLMTTDQLPATAYPMQFVGPGGRTMDGTGFGLGFYVRKEITGKWDPEAQLGEYGWGGSANTFYWVSPVYKLIVITLQQSIPFEWDFGVKRLIYDAVER